MVFIGKLHYTMLRKARETKLKLIQESNERLMNEYSWKEESPLESEIRRKVGLVFATWMSPDNPPFAQEYLYDPKYFDGLISNIMDAVNDKTNTKTRY